MSIIELVRDIWMNNAYVKFEERSLNPSKVIADRSEMARNTIKSDFRTSKMSAGSHFVKKLKEK